MHARQRNGKSRAEFRVGIGRAKWAPNRASSLAPITSPPITATGKNELMASRTNRKRMKVEGPGCRAGTRAYQPMPAPAGAVARVATSKTVAQPELATAAMTSSKL